jgi:hypothetical protein
MVSLSKCRFDSDSARKYLEEDAGGSLLPDRQLNPQRPYDLREDLLSRRNRLTVFG